MNIFLINHSISKWQFMSGLEREKKAWKCENTLPFWQTVVLWQDKHTPPPGGGGVAWLTLSLSSPSLSDITAEWLIGLLVTHSDHCRRVVVPGTWVFSSIVVQLVAVLVLLALSKSRLREAGNELLELLSTLLTHSLLLRLKTPFLTSSWNYRRTGH